MSVCIIGSCVTRDVWRVAGPEKASLAYFPRASFISLMSPPVEISEGDLALDSAYERRVVMEEARRSALSWIKQNKPSSLILDYVDERFDLWDLGGGRYLNESWELHKSGVVGRKFPEAQLIQRFSEGVTILWERAAGDFFRFLERESPETKIFLHRSLLASRICDGEDILPCADDYMSMGKPRSISATNLLLGKYFSFTENAVRQLVRLEVPEQMIVASKAHVWGASALSLH